MNAENAAELNKSGKKLNMVVTGGGSSWANNFLEHGGGSNTLSSFYVPYSTKSIDVCIGGKPREKYVSDSTARQLATIAFIKCAEHHDAENAIGVGLTCTLTRGPEDRDNRYYGGFIAIQTLGKLTCINFKIPSSNRNRIEQESIVSNLLDFAVLDAVNISTKIDNVLETFSVERWETFTDPFETRISTLMNLTHLRSDWEDSSYFNAVESFEECPSPLNIFSGSFNPFHEAHKHIAEDASNRLGKVVLELCVLNFDKPPLDIKEIITRVRNLRKLGYDIIVTNSPNILHKSILCPNSCFIMGIDTFRRIDTDDYSYLVNRNCKLLVHPRDNDTLQDSYKFVPVIHPETFNLEPSEYTHLSSTQIRKQNDEKAKI